MDHITLLTLIDFVAYFALQKSNFENPQLSTFGSEAEVDEVRNTIQQLLRWAWKHNNNLDEQAAQLHMLTGWAQIVEVNGRNSYMLSNFFLKKPNYDIEN